MVVPDDAWSRPSLTPLSNSIILRDGHGHNHVGCRPVTPSNGSRAAARWWSISTLSGCLRSLRAQVALDGVSWVQSGSVEIAVGQTTACYRIGAVICSLPQASLRLGARFDLQFGRCCPATPV